ncbi:hypothetical protein MNBD_GAMMA09-3552 [hydrothermal vent metagenome]|uniref:Uncharacterized protein n=1 Tax=hydrothermal vent metagenome TaxID=652676 RepID=A0A3B0XWV9_9ZZZZ
MIELDPKYIDVIIRHWQDYTGKQATRVEDGAVFNELAEHLQEMDAANNDH